MGEGMGPIGIINFLKPAGMTSHDAVYMLRRLTGEKRVGHTGTLDPMAVGVLPLCVGNATRIIDYLDPHIKEYRCEMTLGMETTTWDIWGEVLVDRRPCAQDLSAERIDLVLSSFIGEQFQLPPAYSAIRVNGKHLYEYARKEQEVTIVPRPVIVYSISKVEFDAEQGKAVFNIRCAKGTYIRSICHEAGQALGCGATMSFLARTATGAFQIEDAVTAEELNDDWKGQLIAPDFPLGHLGAIEVPPKRVPWFTTGGSLRKNEITITRTPGKENTSTHISLREGLDRAYCAYCEGLFLGVMVWNDEKNLFVADKVFCR